LNEIEEDNMTQIKINKMLEPTGSNFITLERITLDERAPAEIRLTAFLTHNEKHKEYPVQILDQDVKRNNLKISLDSNNKLNV
jgi:hypothetical protein